MRYLVTGGAGFIGSQVVRLLLEDPEVSRITVYDALTDAGARENLPSTATDARLTYLFEGFDVRDAFSCLWALEPGYDVVLHLAAESGVDRSLVRPDLLVDTNVRGTLNLLEAARRFGVKRFVQVSIEEVYGPWRTGTADEESPLAPSSPYAASKAAAELFVRAYARTYGLDTVITRGSNTYGPRQSPEKLVPKTIIRALADQPIPLDGDSSPMRDWIHVEDHARGILCAARHGRPGETYNVGGGNERTHRQIVQKLCELLGKAPNARVTRGADRAGHDERYASTTRKIEALGWRPLWPLKAGLLSTVAWYMRNPAWIARAGARA